MQFKGNIHINFCETISEDELSECNLFEKNEKFKRLAEIIDSKIYSSYHIWKTNMIAYDILNSSQKYSDSYTSDECSAFKDYCDFKISGFDGDKEEIKDIFLSIYANPLIRSER